MNHPVKYIDSYNIASYNKSIALLYRKLPGIKSPVLSDRVASISMAFLGRPYILGAAGEGHEGQFDQAPLYRFDGFDCVTFVNVVIALAMSTNVVNFRRNLIRINYRDAQLGYQYRHHFMSVDWNLHNQSIRLVKDITSDIVDANGHAIFQKAEALIDCPGWFRRRTFNDIRLLQKVTVDQEEALLDKLQAFSKIAEAKQSDLPYLPICSLFDKNAKPIMDIFQQIPHGSVVEIVRPNWELKEKIGTNLNVSHVGFAIRKNGQLVYRQASSIEQRVCDVPLTEYLQHRIESPSIKGINVQQILEP